MWTRKDLKEKAKAALKRNYWKAVLVSLLLIMMGEGFAPAAAASGSSSELEQSEIETEGEAVENYIVHDAIEESIEESLREIEQVEESEQTVYIVVFMVVVVTILIIASVIVILADVFLVNPLSVGTKRFMLNSVDNMGNIADLGYAFDHNYKNAVKTTFTRDLHIFLWTLLLVIPGIYKRYQYYMVDYILAENPGMPYTDVLEKSKKMMEGQKWNTFVLDLSFILWHMLSTVTCGILEIFYVKPYVKLTRASLYRALTDGTSQL
ncbi:MAG: DUF975 family protein [Lachnospiraceae bacterium]|nr:DUF975 family protein [Lachnospiraceae bacterium]